MKKLIQNALIIVILLTMNSCGTEILFIVGFSATWNVEGDPHYTIELRQDSENSKVEKGIFTGQELHQLNPDLNQNLLVGSFDGTNIEFVIQRINLGEEIKYKGTMEIEGSTDCSTAVRINLTSEQGHLVLIPQ